MDCLPTKIVDAHMVSLELFNAVVPDDVMPVWRFCNMHSTGSFLLPERVEFRWENGELVRMAVYGKRMKKDGTVGNGDSSTQFVMWGKVLQENPIPDWLASLVAECAPKGSHQ
jgi:hypothetical protein